MPGSNRVNAVQVIVLFVMACLRLLIVSYDLYLGFTNMESILVSAFLLIYLVFEIGFGR